MDEIFFIQDTRMAMDAICALQLRKCICITIFAHSGREGRSVRGFSFSKRSTKSNNCKASNTSLSNFKGVSKNRISMSKCSLRQPKSSPPSPPHPASFGPSPLLRSLAPGRFGVFCLATFLPVTLISSVMTT